MIASVVLSAMAILFAGYVLYGRFLARQAGLDDSRPTPAVTVNDGEDFVPARASLLMGQHFSAIAAAGPIVGPIMAAIWFGWLPALAWILVGSIFIGGVHDFLSLAASVRHRGASIGELIRSYMTPNAYFLFLIFVWFALVYVIIAFTDITAQTFKITAAGTAFGPGVAVSSFLYILLAVAMGAAMRRGKLGVAPATLIFLPLVLLVIWIGPHAPHTVLDFIAGVPVKTWDIVILAYCFAASLIPVWLLLQPRGYLGGWLLYLTIAAGLFGAIFGGFAVGYPAVNLAGLKSVLNGKPVLPVIFITIACGACSGFHGIVSSGTTSKQLARESDALPIGYGTMLLEGLVAVLALATVMMLAPGAEALAGDPNLVYASGLARYLGLIGVNETLALGFMLLAFSTFVYDTLDVCTRLARYIMQELLGLRGRAGAFLATAMTLALPLAVLMLTREKGYLMAWPIFGTSNQLLASLTLLALSVWLVKTGKRAAHAMAAMAFMTVITLWALVLQIRDFLRSLPALFSGGAVKPDVVIAGIVGIILFILSVLLIVEAVRALRARPAAAAR